MFYLYLWLFSIFQLWKWDSIRHLEQDTVRCIWNVWYYTYVSKISLKDFEPFLKTGVISASLTAAGKTNVTMSLKLSHIKHANMSAFFQLIFVEVSFSWLALLTKIINLFENFFVTYLQKVKYLLLRYFSRISFFHIKPANL